MVSGECRRRRETSSWLGKESETDEQLAVEETEVDEQLGWRR